MHGARGMVIYAARATTRRRHGHFPWEELTKRPCDRLLLTAVVFSKGLYKSSVAYPVVLLC